MSDLIVATSLVLSFVTFGFVARWYLMPLLRRLPLRDALTPILLLHTFRHVGLMFLATGAVKTGLPRAFAVPAAYGDLVAATLAFLALAALRNGWKLAIPLVWIFNVEGSVDLVYAVTQGVRNGAAGGMGAAFWIPAVLVPLLLVTHGIVFALLMSKRTRIVPA